MTALPLYRMALTLACLGMGTLPLQAGAQVSRCTDARTGQVTYTDGACPTGAQAREVAPRKSPEELQYERDLADQALARKRQQLDAENASAESRARAEADLERARAARAAAQTPQAHDYARSAECARSRRLVEQASSSIYRSHLEQTQRVESARRQMDLDCLGPEGYAELEKARAAQPRIVVPQRPATLYPPLYPPIYPSTAPPPVPVYPPAPPPAPRYLTQCGDFRCTDNQGTSYPRTGPGRFSGPGGVCRSAGGQAPC